MKNLMFVFCLLCIFSCQRRGVSQSFSDLKNDQIQMDSLELTNLIKNIKFEDYEDYLIKDLFADYPFLKSSGKYYGLVPSKENLRAEPNCLSSLIISFDHLIVFQIYLYESPDLCAINFLKGKEKWDLNFLLNLKIKSLETIGIIDFPYDRYYELGKISRSQ